MRPGPGGPAPGCARPDADVRLGAVARRLRDAGCVFAEEEAGLLVSCAASEQELWSWVERRATGAPLEQVLGWAAFCGLAIALAPGVFAPRRRTEFLVREALAVAHPGAVVVDLCCGSGAIAAALAARVGPVEVHAVDIDPAAAACARRNLGPTAHVYTGDLYAPLPPSLQGRVDLLVCNAPYVPTEAMARMPREARLYEPRIALDGGRDGLDVQRRVAARAPRWLAPDGALVLETSERQAPDAARVLRAAGLAARVARDEDLDATVVVGVRPAAARA